MIGYRDNARPAPRVPPRTPWLRVAWAWARGVFRRLEQRRLRRLSDADALAHASRSLQDAFEVAAARAGRRSGRPDHRAAEALLAAARRDDDLPPPSPGQIVHV